MNCFSFIMASLLVCSSLASEIDEDGANVAGNDDDAQELSRDFVAQTSALVDLVCGCRGENDNDASDVRVSELPTDCYDVMEMGYTKSGRYIIYPYDQGPANNLAEASPVHVWCDMDTDGGGWTVFQRREDGSEEDFNRDWEGMKAGFGSIGGEYWLGNENIHIISYQRDYTLRVELEDWDGNQRYATYDHFRVGNENADYKLLLGSYAGDAGDSLSLHNNQAFSTKDEDNDKWGHDCVARDKGPWWFNSCQDSNLNGEYNKETGASHEGITWYQFKGPAYSLKRAEMKMRPLIAELVINE